MTKKELANAFRFRQLRLGRVSKKILNLISDDEIIDSYITCSHCKHKQVTDKRQLVEIIEKSEHVEHFFNLCDEVSPLCGNDIVQNRNLN